MQAYRQCLREASSANINGAVADDRCLHLLPPGHIITAAQISSQAAVQAALLAGGVEEESPAGDVLAAMSISMSAAMAKAIGRASEYY